MKKSILFLSILFFTFIVIAEIEVSPSIQRARQHRLELVQKQDELLDLLLQIPFEQRQYIFPLLSAKQSVPKKIKTHPEVLVWKGKRPTRIADRFKDDEELIEFLPEQFYNFLSPDMWAPQMQQNPAEINPNLILQSITQQANTAGPSIVPDELVDIYQGLNVLKEWLQQGERKPDPPLYFKTWITEIPENIHNKIKQKTNLSAQEFADKIDAITYSYRAYQKQKIPPISDEQKLVQEYWALIPFIFQKTGFQDTLNLAVYQD